MKNIKIAALIMAAMFTIQSNSIAQKESDNQQTEQGSQKKKSKFGSFVRKVGEASTGINMSNEMFIVNPASSYVDIQLVGCFGNSNTQQVELVFTAKSKSSDYNSARFGGSSQAYDTKGNIFKEYHSGGESAPLPAGVPVKYTIKRIEKVPSTLQAFELISSKWYLDAGHHDQGKSKIEFRNVPIQWDVTPGQTANTAPDITGNTTIKNPANSLIDINFVGCYGDSINQNVQLVFLVKSKSGKYENARFGGSSQAYDTNGNGYKEYSSGGESVSIPEGIPVKYTIKRIEKIPPTIKGLSIISVKWYLDAGHHDRGESKIEFKNVPIQWNVSPE